MKRHIIRSLFAVGIILTSLPAMSQDITSNASGIALSEAVRSTAVGPTALTYNPAAMHQFVQYAVETSYRYAAPASGHVFSASIVDSATNQALAAGMSYTYLMDEPLGSGERKGHVIRGALASGYRTREFSVHFGLGIGYYKFEPKGGKELDEVSLDVGVLLVLKNMFRLAVVGHNLIETGLADAPRRLGLGGSFLYRSFLLSFDSVLDFETLDTTQAQYNVGLEYSVQNRIPIRVGYQMDRITEKQSISGGIGYVTRVFSVEFGFRQNLEDKTDNVFSINVRAFLP